MKASRFNEPYGTDSIATSVGVSGLTTALCRLVGLARGVSFVWLIPQPQFGLFGVVLLLVNVPLSLCSAGLYEGVARYAPALILIVAAFPVGLGWQAAVVVLIVVTSPVTTTNLFFSAEEQLALWWMLDLKTAR